MARFGEPTWFNLGDRDLATHLHRSRLIRDGRTLTEATASVAPASAPGPPCCRCPPAVADAHPRLRRMARFQEYFVRDKAQAEVREVQYVGADTARPASGVLEAHRRRRRGHRLPVESHHLDRSHPRRPRHRGGARDDASHRHRGESHRGKRRGVGSGRPADGGLGASRVGRGRRPGLSILARRPRAR